MTERMIFQYPTTPRRSRSGLAVKAALAIAACLVVRLLAAQAPAASEGANPEETDAQGYKIQVPLPALSKGPKARSEEQKFRSKVRAILGGTENLNAERRSFRGYFQQYLFPMMTTEEGQKTIGADRQNLLRDLQNAKSKEAHDELTAIALPAMQKIAADPAYRLSARYNAMLIIASLNEQEATSNSVPQALATALPFMLQQYRKPENHDSLKIAALIGMARHLELDNYKPPGTPIPTAGKTEIIKDFTALAEAKEAPDGRDAQVHNWMRRRAIEGLAYAALIKPDVAIAATIEKLIKDESDEIDVRLAAASALGRISLLPPVKLDAAEAAKELGYLALVACNADLTRAESYRKTQAEHEARLGGTYSAEIDYSGASGPPGGGYGGLGGYGTMSGEGGGGYGGLGGGPTIRRPTPGTELGGISDSGDYGSAGGVMNDPSMMDPKHYRVDYLRRRMRQHLYAVQQGLAGNDDFVPPRTTGQKGGSQGANATKTSASDNANPADRRGVHSIAKGAEQEAVKQIYYKVRRLAEIIEVAGDKADFFQLVKDMRSELRPLEDMTKRLPAAGVATAVGSGDDAPSNPARKAGAKAGSPKANPVKAGPPAVKGKSAYRRAAPRFQPNVTAKPRFGR